MAPREVLSDINAGTLGVAPGGFAATVFDFRNVCAASPAGGAGKTLAALAGDLISPNLGELFQAPPLTERDASPESMDSVVCNCILGDFSCILGGGYERRRVGLLPLEGHAAPVLGSRVPGGRGHAAARGAERAPRQRPHRPE